MAAIEQWFCQERGWMGSDKVRILIVGLWRWPQYEPAFAEGLRAHGAKVTGLSAASFFKGRSGRLQLTIPFPVVPALMRLNRQIMEVADAQRPDWILFWRPTHILPSTLKIIGDLVQGLTRSNVVE